MTTHYPQALSSHLEEILARGEKGLARLALMIGGHFLALPKDDPERRWFLEYLTARIKRLEWQNAQMATCVWPVR